jgi:hypothetical protein
MICRAERDDGDSNARRTPTAVRAGVTATLAESRLSAAHEGEYTARRTRHASERKIEHMHQRAGLRGCGLGASGRDGRITAKNGHDGDDGNAATKVRHGRSSCAAASQ